MALYDPASDTAAAWRARHGIRESRPLAHPEEQRIAEREVQALRDQIARRVRVV